MDVSESGSRINHFGSKTSIVDPDPVEFKTIGRIQIQ